MSRIAILVLLALVSSLAGFAPAPDKGKGKQADEWSLFRRTAEQTGTAASTAPDKLDVLWSFKAEDSIESAVAVVKDVVYAAGMDEHLYAIDLTTGKQTWKYKGAPFKAPPAVRDGLVYVGDLDGVLHCVDAARGVNKWKFEAGSEAGGANFHGTEILFGSHDEKLYCVRGTGKEAWT